MEGYKQKTPQIWKHLILYLFTLNMKNTLTQDQKIAKMTFASIYPHYVNKIEKKNRSKDELHKVIEWLTGFKIEELEKFIEQNITFESFFMNATLNKNAHLITGTISVSYTHLTLPTN